jgi:hypothetical protein
MRRPGGQERMSGARRESLVVLRVDKVTGVFSL